MTTTMPHAPTTTINIRDQTWLQVWIQVYQNLQSRVWDQVHAQGHDQTKLPVLPQFKDQVWNQTEEQVGTTLKIQGDTWNPTSNTKS